MTLTAAELKALTMKIKRAAKSLALRANTPLERDAASYGKSFSLHIATNPVKAEEFLKFCEDHKGTCCNICGTVVGDNHAWCDGCGRCSTPDSGYADHCDLCGDATIPRSMYQRGQLK